MAKTWPSGSSPGPGNDFWAKIHKKELIPGKKQMIWCQSQPPRTTPGPEMAKTWPSGSSPGTGNDFWAKILQRESIPSNKQMIWCQSQPPRTTPVPEMAKTWPSGTSPGPGNDFWYKILKKELTLGEKQMIWCQSQPPWTTLVPEMAKIWPSGASHVGCPISSFHQVSWDSSLCIKVSRAIRAFRALVIRVTTPPQNVWKHDFHQKLYCTQIT